MIVEYEGEGETYPGIIKAASRNRRWRHGPTKSICRMTKDTDGGGYGVVEVAQRMGMGRHKQFAVVGVNTGYCVLDTAREILKAKKGSKIILPVWCCRTQFDDDEHHTTEQLLHSFQREHFMRVTMTFDHRSLPRRI